MDHFTYQHGELYAENVALAALAAEIGTPFYCYSSATFERHFKVFDDALSGYRRKICFAVKSNSNPAILRTLGNLGAGADVVSGGEIRLALAAGIPTSKIVFSGVAKTREELAFALEQNIFQFNAESAFELKMLNEVATQMGRRAPVALRVNPDVDPATHAKISTGQKENKFGIAMEDVAATYALAASLPALDVQGVSMHIGSQLTTLEPFRQAFRAVLKLVADLRAAGHAIRTLDLGGGLGVPYGNHASPPDPLAYAQAVKDEVGHFEGELIFEPGRMIAGNAGVIVSRVIGVKESPHKCFLMIDAAMNDLMRPALYDAYHEIIGVKEWQEANGEKSTHHYDIVGPVCESSDIFGKDRPLPEMKEGDLVAIRSCGAYGASMSNSYNARPLIPEVLVRGNQWSLIRRRPSYEEMQALYQSAEWQI